MSDLSDVLVTDRAIADVEPWIIRAAAALLTQWNEPLSYFDRDTTTRSENTGKSSYPKGRVSTALALMALTDYLRFLQETPESIGRKPAFEAILGGDTQVLGEHLPEKEWVEQVACGAWEQVHQWSSRKYFARAHPAQGYLASVTALALSQHSAYWSHFGTHCSQGVDAGRDVYNRAQLNLERVKYGNAEANARNYYATFVALQAHDLCQLENQKGDNAIWDTLGPISRQDLQACIGDRLGNLGSHSTTADLVFGATVLDRLEEDNAEPMVNKAIELAVAGQHADGSWPCPPLISLEESVLQISSYDIAHGLACLLLNQFGRSRWQNGKSVLSALGSVAQLAQTTKETVRTRNDQNVNTGTFVGWSSDGIHSSVQVVTAYTTARVLSFLIRYRDALIAYRQHLVLGKYSVVASHPLRVTLWSDLANSMCCAGGTVSGDGNKALANIRNPFSEFDLAERVELAITRPIAETSLMRPASDHVSFLLPGPPGTGKTTLMIKIAEHLNWPLVLLSPPDFLREGGLESIQGVATEIFDDLMRLRRAVILFDECEELFRARGNEDLGYAQSRTDGAFLTAAMLPRLQRLHDTQWVVFALATNETDPKRLDEAAMRRGRFDFEIFLPHPQEKRQIEYLRANLMGIELRNPSADSSMPAADIVTEVLSRAPATGSQTQEPSWATLEQIVRRTKKWVEELNKERDGRDFAARRSHLVERLERFWEHKKENRGAPSLVAHPEEIIEDVLPVQQGKATPPERKH